MNWILIALPAAIWLTLRLVLPNRAYEFDFDAQHATFSLLLGNYIKLAGGMIVACLAAALFGRWQHLPQGVVLSCLVGALYAFLFILWTQVTYERYLHHRYGRNGTLGPSIYTAGKYAATHALGWSAVACSVVGIGMTVMLAWQN